MLFTFPAVSMNNTSYPWKPNWNILMQNVLVKIPIKASAVTMHNGIYYHNENQLFVISAFVTWLTGISQMLEILILSYWLTNRSKILMLYTVFNFEKGFISLQPDIRLRWVLDQNVTFKWTSDLHWKLKFVNMWLIPLDHVTFTEYLISIASEQIK